jgi:hypothetical protein
MIFFEQKDLVPFCEHVSSFHGFGDEQDNKI